MTPQPPESLRARIKSDHAAAAALAAEVASLLERHHYTKAERFAVRLALEEALSNAIRHGHRGLPPETPVEVEVSVHDRAVAVSVQDQGPGFSPDAIPDPTLDENLAKPDGRGLMLMRAYMTTVRYNDKGNRLDMTYERNSP